MRLELGRLSVLLLEYSSRASYRVDDHVENTVGLLLINARGAAISAV